MNRQEIIQELRSLRAVTQELEQNLARLILEMERESPEDRQEQRDLSNLIEEIYPLAKNPSSFKGRRPLAVIFPDGTRVRTPSWKGVVEAILKDCDRDENRHEALMSLRNRIYGSSRIILGDSADEMQSPIAVAPKLFCEAHYDVCTLLRITLTRILSVVGYDYSGIQVAVRK